MTFNLSIILTNDKMQLDLEISKWNKIAGNIGSICSDNWSYNNKSKIEIIERIGSESSQGEVYRLKIKDFEFAGKILPIISDKSKEDNDNEISIAKQLSEEVKQKRTIYFPIVYDSGFCEKTVFNKNSLFYEDSYKYSLINYLCQKENMNSACKKRITHQFKNLTVEEIKRLYPEFHDINIQSQVLFSEICFSDLRQFILMAPRFFGNEEIFKTKKDESFWVSMIAHTLEAIRYLNEEMNILHNDLHTGNVLLRSLRDNNTCLNYQPLIHDFGKSRRLNCWTMYDRITDPGKFLYDLMIMDSNIPDRIKIKCNKVLEYIDKIKNELDSRPIMKEIIDKFLFE